MCTATLISITEALKQGWAHQITPQPNCTEYYRNTKNISSVDADITLYILIHIRTFMTNHAWLQECQCMLPCVYHISKDWVKMWKELWKIWRSGQSLRQLSPWDTVSRRLKPQQTPSIPRESCIRYHVSVEECTWVHETGRTLKQQITEYKWAIKNADSNNGLAVHIARTEHKDKAEVVCREEQWTKRKIKESLSIKAHANNPNLDAGLYIDTNWNPPS